MPLQASCCTFQSINWVTQQICVDLSTLHAYCPHLIDHHQGRGSLPLLRSRHTPHVPES